MDRRDAGGNRSGAAGGVGAIGVAGFGNRWTSILGFPLGLWCPPVENRDRWGSLTRGAARAALPLAILISELNRKYFLRRDSGGCILARKRGCFYAQNGIAYRGRPAERQRRSFLSAGCRLGDQRHRN